MYYYSFFVYFFFFQAEDGIRDVAVTGVQTCALPIHRPVGSRHRRRRGECGAPLPAGGAGCDARRVATGAVASGGAGAVRALPRRAGRGGGGGGVLRHGGCRRGGGAARRSVARRDRGLAGGGALRTRRARRAGGGRAAQPDAVSRG